MDEFQRLSIAVDALMRIMQATQHVADDAQGVRGGHRASNGVGVVDDPAQGGAGDVLHGDKVGAAVLAEVVDLHNVRMIEQGLHASFVDEHRLNLAVAEQLFVDAFDHEGFFEPTRARFSTDKNLGHAARSQQFSHVIGPNLFCHGLPGGTPCAHSSFGSL